MHESLFSLEYKYRVSATTFAMPPMYIPFTFSHLYYTGLSSLHLCSAMLEDELHEKCKSIAS